MSRCLLLAGSAAALVGAVLLAPSPTAAPGRPLTALGRSLGGARVLLVDVLFLRAESLRLRGRTEELPALYEALVDLDPDNVAALDALAGELCESQLGAAPTPEAQAGWWQAAWDLVRRGLEAHPGSPSLAFRAADLLLSVPEAHPALAPAVDRAAGGLSAREERGLAFLVLAQRATPHLPRAGRLHLTRLARLGPLLAARALARGEPPERAALRLAAAEETYARHGAVLAEVLEEVQADPGEPRRGPRTHVPLAPVLAAALGAVRAALLEADGAPRGPARRALDAYRQLAGATPLARELEGWLSRSR